MGPRVMISRAALESHRPAGPGQPRQPAAAAEAAGATARRRDAALVRKQLEATLPDAQVMDYQRRQSGADRGA